ncbi:MAG TPA: cysteine--tRNA ligase [Actinomycetota bacterium]
MRLYSSLSRQVEEVKPVDGGTVKIYSCGPTVYRYIHIGNFRSFMLGDLIRRVARFEGLDAFLVMNITDVGHMTDEVSDSGRDKMELAQDDEGLSPDQIAEKYTDAFLSDGDLLNIGRADVYPRATSYIPQMIRIIEGLIANGHAYEVGGTVYYDVTTFPEYGKLSGNTLEALRAGHRQEVEIDPNKRHAADFALWKHAGPNRLLKWPSPWGEGYPGWHIECSAMSMDLLGDRFDVHTGGNDNKFPHHEDEIAQSEGYTGHPVVSIWVHGGFLQMGELKMAKSQGNVIRVPDLAARGLDPLAYRLLCLRTRYRSEMNFNWEALEGANARLTSLRQRVAEAAVAGDASGDDGALRPLGQHGTDLDRRFRDAVSDDLDMPAALVVLDEAASAPLPPWEKHALFRTWDQVLGLDLERIAQEAWTPSDEMADLVRRRDEARAARDFAEADTIRDRLTGMGLEVMDTAEGTKVRPRR